MGWPVLHTKAAHSTTLVWSPCSFRFIVGTTKSPDSADLSERDVSECMAAADETDTAVGDHKDL